MKFLSDSVIVEGRNFLLNRLNEATTARYYSGGEAFTVPLYKSRAGDGKLEFSLRVPAGVSLVEKIEILDGNGVLLMSKTEAFEKNPARPSFTQFEVDVQGLIV